MTTFQSIWSLTRDQRFVPIYCPARLFHKFFVQELLHPVPATVSFVTYLQEPIPVSGVFETSVRFGDTVAQGRIYIVERGEPILGRDLISALQLILQDNMVKRIRPATNDTNNSSGLPMQIP